jgi:hypothetical protein
MYRNIGADADLRNRAALIRGGGGQADLASRGGGRKDRWHSLLDLRNHRGRRPRVGWWGIWGKRGRGSMLSAAMPYAVGRVC